VSRPEFRLRKWADKVPTEAFIQSASLHTGHQHGAAVVSPKRVRGENLHNERSESTTLVVWRRHDVVENDHL
jgi:hypothetical protein